MNRFIFYFLITVFCLSAGILIFFISQNKLIVQWNYDHDNKSNLSSLSKNIVLCRQINLYYWKYEKFYSEPISVIWFSDKSESLKYLINRWLVFLQEERIINKRIMVESVAFSQSGQEIFCSFDQYPFIRDWSTFNKLCFIQSFLKTIVQSGFDIKKVNFLVGHQSLQDDHLDFSVSWPINGFLDLAA